MTHSIGNIVHYVMSETDANEANRRRTDGPSILRRLTNLHWHEGAQAHIGTPARAGDVLPMLIVKVNPPADPGGETTAPVTVNGQVFLNGNDVLWVRERSEVVADSTDKQGHWFDQGAAVAEHPEHPEPAVPPLPAPFPQEPDSFMAIARSTAPAAVSEYVGDAAVSAGDNVSDAAISAPVTEAPADEDHDA